MMCFIFCTNLYMKNLIFKNLAILVIPFILSACSSTLHLHDKEQCKPYARVIVNDFKDKVSKKHNNPHIIAEGKRFADMLANEIIKKDLFDKVDRNIESDEEALLIDGDILKYQEDDAMLRFVVGFGAGSSGFKATAYLRDNKTKKIIANIHVNETSGITGGFANKHKIKHTIRAAAKSVAQKCSKFKPN